MTSYLIVWHACADPVTPAPQRHLGEKARKPLPRRPQCPQIGASKRAQTRHETWEETDVTIAARPWAAAYPSGVPAEVTAPLARTLGQLVRDTAAREGDRTAYTVVMPNGMYGDLSFAEVDRLSDAFAAWLREVAGLQPGDRVALQTPNSLTVPVVAFGTFKAGCVKYVDPRHVRKHSWKTCDVCIKWRVVSLEEFRHPDRKFMCDKCVKNNKSFKD